MKCLNELKRQLIQFIFHNGFITYLTVYVVVKVIDHNIRVDCGSDENSEEVR